MIRTPLPAGTNARFGWTAKTEGLAGFFDADVQDGGIALGNLGLVVIKGVAGMGTDGAALTTVQSNASPPVVAWWPKRPRSPLAAASPYGARAVQYDMNRRDGG